MRKNIHAGTYVYEVLSKDESILDFRDMSGTLAFLRPFKNDPFQMAIMRAEVAAHAGDAKKLDSEAVLRKFAELLISRKIRILKSIEFLNRATAGEDGAEKAPKENKQGPAPAKKSWIEIYLIDAEGKPVPGEKYQIKLTDGSTEEGRLDGFGHAEYYGINPGSCKLWFPDLDPDAWDFA